MTLRAPRIVVNMTKFDYALLLLRVSFGLSMAYHGINKLRGNGLAGTASWFDSLGMKWPRQQAITASTGEILSGLLLALGLFTPIACAIFVALMLVAIWTVHWKVGYFIFLPNGGWEYCASIIVVATAISLVGPGAISIDNAIDIPISWGAWATPVGILATMCHLALSYRPKKTPSIS